MPAVVKGYTEVQRALKNADRDIRLGFQREMRKVAEPIRQEAETLSLTRIRRMRYSPQWAEQRVGVTQKLVYVAPKKRGIRRGDSPAKRPDLAVLMVVRAFEPALSKHAPNVINDFEQVLGAAAVRFNRDNHGMSRGV